jgi:hypothetical protein
MSWNIELMCIRDSQLRLDAAVPDVFGPTGEQLGFEDATSATRDDQLSAARIGEWVVVIDVGCRLSSALEDGMLDDVIQGRDVHVFCVADSPFHAHYQAGVKSSEHDGTEACLAALRGPARARDDGELVAWDLLHEQTGLAMGTDLFDATYAGYAP